jgi:hypothetical protein
MFGPSCETAHKKRAQSGVSHHWAFEMCAMPSDLTKNQRAFESHSDSQHMSAAHGYLC